MIGKLISEIVVVIVLGDEQNKQITSIQISICMFVHLCMRSCMCVNSSNKIFLNQISSMRLIHINSMSVPNFMHSYSFAHISFQ